MVTREYTCPVDGMFFVKRPISAPLEEKCPKCNADASRSYLSGNFPTWGILGNGIPNNATDMTEYEGWQRKRWAEMEAECHVDNMGYEPRDPKSLVKKHTFGKDD